MKILLLIRSLERGGAERQLQLLANGLASHGHSVTVGVFYSGGAFEAGLRDVELVDFRKTGKWDFFGFPFRVSKWLSQERPDVVYSFMGANFFTGLLRAFHPDIPMVWGVRASNCDLGRYGFASRVASLLELVASRQPALIVANSFAGKEYVEGRGYPSERLKVLHNGIDTTVFAPDSGGTSLKNRWGISKENILVGQVARLDPMKGYEFFIDAAAISLRTDPRLRFVCVGDGPDQYMEFLKKRAIGVGLENRMTFVGPMDDLPAVYDALDICCLSSIYGEGFPNVLGEALSCATPCVCTEVGDAPLVVGDVGVVIKPGQASDFAGAILHLAKMDEAKRRALGASGRARIIQKFSVEKMVERTEEVLGGVVAKRLSM